MNEWMNGQFHNESIWIVEFTWKNVIDNWPWVMLFVIAMFLFFKPNINYLS